MTELVRPRMGGFQLAAPLARLEERLARVDPWPCSSARESFQVRAATARKPELRRTVRRAEPPYVTQVGGPPAGAVVRLVGVTGGLNRTRLAQDAELLAAWESASHVVGCSRTGAVKSPLNGMPAAEGEVRAAG